TGFPNFLVSGSGSKRRWRAIQVRSLSALIRPPGSTRRSSARNETAPPGAGGGAVDGSRLCRRRHCGRYQMCGSLSAPGCCTPLTQPCQDLKLPSEVKRSKGGSTDGSDAQSPTTFSSRSSELATSPTKSPDV